MASGGREPPDGRLQLLNFLARESNQGAHAPRSPSPRALSPSHPVTPSPCAPLSPLAIGGSRWRSLSSTPATPGSLPVTDISSAQSGVRRGVFLPLPGAVFPPLVGALRVPAAAVFPPL